MWRNRAACLGTDPAVFYPGRDAPAAASRAARAICADCPVVDDCLAYALAQPKGETYGVWGGMTADEINALRVQRNGTTRPGQRKT